MAWRILAEDFDDGGDYVDPSESFDFCGDCDQYFWRSEETGHVFCGCGFWLHDEEG